MNTINSPEPDASMKCKPEQRQHFISSPVFSAGRPKALLTPG